MVRFASNKDSLLFLIFFMNNSVKHRLVSHAAWGLLITLDFTIFAHASDGSHLRRRMKSARNDVEEKHSLGGWGCVVHSGNVSRECDNIQLCSRETSRTQT